MSAMTRCDDDPGALLDAMATVRATARSHQSAVDALEDVEARASVRATAVSHQSAVDALESAFTASRQELESGRAALREDREALLRSVEKKRESVKRERDALQRKCDAFEARMRSMRRIAPPLLEDKITLNVGGVRYVTTRETLTAFKGSMLGTMFGDTYAHMLQQDPEDGSVFINRDGERFGMILDFLRDGDAKRAAAEIQELSAAKRRMMTSELDFFGLEEAVFGPPFPLDKARFVAGPTISESRQNFTTIAVDDNHFLVVGGCGDGDVKATTEILDLESNSVEPGPTMATPRTLTASVVFSAARRAVVFAGHSRAGPRAEVELLDLATMKFCEAPNPTLSKRSACAAAVLDDRRALVVGGSDGVTQLATTEIFDLSTLAFAPGPDMLTARAGAAVVKLDDHRVLVLGGSNAQGYLSTTEVLDLETMHFAEGPVMAFGRTACCAVLLDTHRVLVLGGKTNSKALDTTEVLDLNTMTFAQGPTMREARVFHNAITLGASKVIVIGGLTNTAVADAGNSLVYTGTTEILIAADDQDARGHDTKEEESRKRPRQTLSDGDPT